MNESIEYQKHTVQSVEGSPARVRDAPEPTGSDYSEDVSHLIFGSPDDAVWWVVRWYDLNGYPTETML